MKIKIIMLVGSGTSSKIMFHALQKEFTIEKVIVEKKLSKQKVIKNRMKRLGLLKVFGQVLFLIFNKFLMKISKKQIKYLKDKYHLDDSGFDSDIVEHVESINDEETKKIIRDINPNVIVVNGTRIISTEILTSTQAIFLNTHVGITPKYRGVHGGYWALVEQDYRNCGVTVHEVDRGIDTGNIIYQDRITIGNYDDFNTYPYHQIAKAIPLMKQAIRDIMGSNLKYVETYDKESKLWYHPTLFEYIKYRLILGVK